MNKHIADYANYLINENGQVYNTITKKYLKGSIGENGYKYYRLSNNGQKKMFYAHRLVAEAFIPNPNNLPVVNHKDGCKLNNNIENLEWTSYSDNTLHWHNNNDSIRQGIKYYDKDLPGEIWKEFFNYMISSKGRIRHKIKNNLLKPSVTCGYYKVRLSNNGLVTDYLVHKLVYQVFKDDYNPSLVIDHIDGNKLNNDINNLRQVTNSENALAALYETKTNTTAKPVGQLQLRRSIYSSF